MEHREEMKTQETGKADNLEKILVEFEDGQIKRIWSSFSARVEILNREQIYVLSAQEFGEMERSFISKAKKMERVFP